jgi:polysaccharide chain length determinant protein (PEP-CTERM system associated)
MGQMSAADYAEYEERPARDPLEYLEIPFRYPRHMWIPFAIVMSLALLLAPVMPRKYRSGTMILVESKNVPEYFVVPVTPEGIAQRLNTIRQLIMSRTRLEAVIKKLDPYPELAAQPSHVVVEVMRRGIEIRVQGTDSFSIEYVNRDPVKAMLVTNMLASQFAEDAGRLRDDLTRKAFDFLEANLADTRKALEERENALRSHKQKYWGALPEQLDANLRVLQQLQVEQQTLGESLRTLEDRRAALERGLLEGRRLAASTAPAGPTAELLKLRAGYDSLRGRYTEDHPDMRALRARIQELDRQMGAALKQKEGAKDKDRDLTDPEAVGLTESLRPVEAEIESLKVRRERLDARIRVFQARVEQTPTAEQELAALTRDYDQLRQNYSGALKKEMDAEMAQRLEEYWKGGYFRVLDPAYLPRRPIRPYGTLILLGGFALALGAGLASALVADMLDRSVKTERDLEELVAHPLLITIPRAALPGKRDATA